MKKTLLLTVLAYLSIFIVNAQNKTTADSPFPYVPLIEVFTSSTCPPCKSDADNLKSMLDANTGSYTLIKYQMSWPGSGDPYYTSEGGTKRSLYGVNAAPWTQFNGTVKDVSASSLAQSQKTKTSTGIEAEYTIDEQYVTAKVTIDPREDLSGTNLRLFIAIVEKKTRKNAKSNGQTEFHQVMKKFMPGSDGIAVGNLTAGETKSFEQDWEFQGKYRLPSSASDAINPAKEHSVEDFDNLEVVVWLQNTNTKKVYQSATATLVENPMKKISYSINGPARGTLTAIVDGSPIESGDKVEKGKEVKFIASDIMDGYRVKKWMLNGVDVENNMTNELVAIADGNITVVVSFEIGVTALDEISNDIQIFPNPASDIITINNMSGTDMEIVNTAGQRVIAINNISASQKVDVSILDAGTYIVTFTSNSSVITSQKVVITK